MVAVAVVGVGVVVAVAVGVVVVAVVVAVAVVGVVVAVGVVDVKIWKAINMPRKRLTNIGEQIEQLRNSPGVVSLTVSPAKIPPDWSEYEGPSRRIGSKKTQVVPDLELAARIEQRTPTDGNIFVTIKAKTRCMNSREHYMDRYRRTHDEHTELALVLAEHEDKRAELAKGCTVRMCRIGRKVDSDNLQGYLKGVRDYVAFFLLGGRIGERDSDPRIEWVYEQADCRKGVFGVTVAIERNHSRPCG